MKRDGITSLHGIHVPLLRRNVPSPKKIHSPSQGTKLSTPNINTLWLPMLRFSSFFFYLKFKSSTISNFLQIVNMSEFNKTYRLDGEHIYKGAHVPGFSPTWLLDEIEDYGFDDGDVLIATFPKCGMFFSFI